MKIGIEATPAIQKLGGISEYAYNLINALAKIDQKNQYILVNFSYFRKTLRSFTNFPKNFEIKNINIPNKVIGFLWRNFSWPKLDNYLSDCDVVFKPHFQVPPLDNKNLVLSVCDLSFYHFPDWFTKEDQKRFDQDLKANLPKAKKIIAISQNTKDDLVKMLNIDPNKIVVTPLAVSEIFSHKINPDIQAKVLKKYQIEKPYILYLGTLEPRKNIVKIVEAFQKISQEFPEMKLVLAGRKGWLYEEIFETVKKLGLDEKVIFTGPMEDEERPYLYSNAEVFVYPSLYEGFGLPVLEALTMGVPVVTSNNSSLPEIAGDSALLIDPKSSNQIHDAIKKVLTDKELKSDLIRKGLIQAKKFSWEKCAQQTLEVLKEVGKGN